MEEDGRDCDSANEQITDQTNDTQHNISRTPKAPSEVWVVIVELLFAGSFGTGFWVMGERFTNHGNVNIGGLSTFIAVCCYIFPAPLEVLKRWHKPRLIWPMFGLVCILVGVIFIFTPPSNDASVVRDTVTNLPTVLKNAVESGVKPKDRTIAPENRENFIALLATAPKGGIEVYYNGSSGGDVAQYAEQIRKMLEAAGYEVGRQCSIGLSGETIPKGLIMVLRNTNAVPPFFWAVHNAFKVIGIEAKPWEYPNDTELNEQSVRVCVGRAP